MPFVPIPNFKQIDTQSTPVPPGQYKCAVTKCDIAKAKQSGNDYVAWEFVIREGDHLNRKVWKNSSLSEKAAMFLKRITEAIGEEGESGGFNSESCIGKTLDIVLDIEENNKGEKQNTCVKFLAPSV